MTIIQQVITIAIAAVTNFITRWLPFRLFTSGKDEQDELSPFIKGIGAFLPAAIMGMLVVYCYRNINLLSGNHGLPDLIAGRVHPVAQDPDKVVFSPNISSEQERIDYRMTATQIDNKVRGLRPAPLGNMIIDGLRTKIYDVTPLDEHTDRPAGQVVRATKHQLVLAAGEGTTYQINRLKPAGKQAMDITAYLNGHQQLKEGVQAVSDD